MGRKIVSSFFIALFFWMLSTNGYAVDGEIVNSPFEGFWNSVGGFLYNALPWNWGNWFTQ